MRLRHLTHRSPWHMAEQDPRHMARRYARPEKGDYRYKLILGFFILAFLLGFAGVVYFGMHYSTGKLLFWLFLVWTVFFGVTIYGWTDERRYAKYEHYMIPVVFGAVFLLLVALFIAGLVINVPKILSGENMLTDLLATVIVEASLGAFAYFTYVFFIKEYVDKLLRK